MHRRKYRKRKSLANANQLQPDERCDISSTWIELFGQMIETTKESINNSSMNKITGKTGSFKQPGRVMTAVKNQAEFN